MDTKVLDTRSQKNGDSIRRRRECENCSIRFTTLEIIVNQLPMVVKKDGRREAFSQDKLLNGLKAACQKRPISFALIEQTVEKITQWAQESHEKEITSHSIGQFVMNEIKNLDEVAYVRFASVYKTFTDVSDFVANIAQEKLTSESLQKAWNREP